MSTPSPTVFLVDDDPSVRKSLQYLVTSHGLAVEAFASGIEFLNSPAVDAPGCLVVDYRMPGMNGLEFQQRLRERGSLLPVIVMTAFGDVPTCAQAMKLGALDFLEKPVPDAVLLASIRDALARDSQHRVVAARMHTLTPREREIMQWLVDGMAMKEIATNCRTSFQTVAKHRQRVLEKMGVDNDVSLVKLVLGVGGNGLYPQL